jgi:hypothetical protein
MNPYTENPGCNFILKDEKDRFFLFFITCAIPIACQAAISQDCFPMVDRALCALTE